MCGHDVFSSFFREGKYIPLPQRQREMNRERERAERGPGGPPPHNRLSGGYRSTPPSSSSPRPPLPSAAGPQPGVSPSERNSPLSGRGGAYAPHHPQGSPSPGPGSGPASPYTPASPGGPTPTPATASAAPSPASPPASHGHTVPHSHSLPHSLAEAGRPVNGGKCVNLCQNEYVLTASVSVLRQYELFKTLKEFFFLCPFQSLPEHPLKPKDLHSRAEQSALQTHMLSPQVHSVSCYKIHFCIINGACLIFSLTSLQPLALLNRALPRTRLI